MDRVATFSRQLPEGLMNKLTIAFVAAVSLAAFGCKKGGGGDDAVKKMAEFKDVM